MASPATAFYLSCLLLWKMVQVSGHKESPAAHQEERSFVAIRAGQNLTIRCNDDARFSTEVNWYKQSLGQKPKLICSLQKDKEYSFHDEFKDNPRFNMTREDGLTILTITDLRVSDSATYHCLYSYYSNIRFPVSVTVSVMGSGSEVGGPSLRSGSVQAGGSVAPSCTVHTGSCDGRHNVYWFKSSEESLPGIFYTQGARDGQCDTHTKTCVYQLPRNSVNQPHNEAYHCAVASCGHILLGNGIKPDPEGGVNPWLLVYFLSGALTFTIVSSISLAVSLYKITRRNSSQSAGTEIRSSASATAHTEANQDSDSLHYAALSINKPHRSRRDRPASNNDCIYSHINV